MNDDLPKHPPSMVEPNHVFTRMDVESKLKDTLDKTLGEIDKTGLFDRIAGMRKVTGIAGDVIEQSVFGYAANSKQEPDLMIDGTPTELKVTGIRIRESGKDVEYRAKEPMSITAVSLDVIISEEFDVSNFYHKINHMLLVYYQYDSEGTVTAMDYARFPVKGFEFHQFDERDMRILENDWTTIRDFIRALNDEYDDPTQGYPRLSSELRDKLMYLDTAPKYPNPPRFRFKRSFVDVIVKEYFRGVHTGWLNLDDVTSFEDIDYECHRLTEEYYGMTVGELMTALGMTGSSKTPKSIAEPIVTRMFGKKGGKMSKIDLFVKAGIFVKSIVLSTKGGRTEDMKLMPIDFDEFLDEDIEFEDSEIYEYFANHQILCVMFQEQEGQNDLRMNRFIGFKRLTFPTGFILGNTLDGRWNRSVRHTWNAVRKTVHSGQLKETVETDKSGNPVLNKNGTVSTSINFPKSKEFPVFLRGSGKNSLDKTVTLCGIRMYRQNVWIKGRTIVDLLRDVDFL